MLGRTNGNGCGDHPAGIIGTGYRLHRAHARVCVGDRVDVREAARKMIMLRLLSLLFFFSFSFSLSWWWGGSFSFSLSFSLSRKRRGKSLFVIRLILRLVLFRLNRKPLCSEVSREARCGGRCSSACVLSRATYIGFSHQKWKLRGNKAQ